MSLSDLPDICLLLIFDQFHQFRQFVTLMKVCRRWKNLMENRLEKITHLNVTLATPSMQIDYSLQQSHFLLAHRCILKISQDSLMKIKLSELLPNVKVILIENLTQNCSCAALAHSLANVNKINGLSVELESRRRVLTSRFGYRFEVEHKCDTLKREEKTITSFLSDIQFLGNSNDLLITSYLKRFGHLKKLKSLGNSFGNNFQAVNLRHVLDFAQFLTNIERLVTFCGDFGGGGPLNIGNEEFDNDFVFDENHWRFGDLLDLQFVDAPRDRSYTLNLIPIFGNLLHLWLSSSDGCTSTKFLNSCPNLLDLSLTIRYYPGVHEIHQINKNLNVQRLNLRLTVRQKILILKTIENFPNLRYLSIWCSVSISSRDLIQIISILPHLSLLLIENDLTDLAEKQIVKYYCHSQNPKIDVYFGSTDEELLMSHELYRKFHNSFFL